MNGGEAVVETLMAAGVDTGFTVPGESFLTVLEALRVRRDTFRLVSTRHESGGTFAAEVYGRLAGRPAAVLVSRGPGATNAAIGVHTARQSSSPLLLLVGHVRTRSKGREAFQEIDHHRMFGPVAKAVLEPDGPEGIGETVAEAVRICVAGRPGPVVVVLPRDVTEARVAGNRPPAPVATPILEGPALALNAAAAALARSRFPLVVAGEIVAHERAEDALVAFADTLAAPVMAAYRQLDVFPNHHPAYAGHLDINRAPFQREAFARADLVLAVGTRLDGITTEDYTLLGRGQRLVHLYPDAEVLERAAADVAVHCDVTTALVDLHRRVDGASDERRAWRDRLHEAYLSLSTAGPRESRGAVDLAAVAGTVADATGGDAVVLTDGGSFARWVHRYYRFSKPRRFAGPVSGAMGYAVPGAIGAALACPASPVIAFVGDGGFMMTGQELTTAAREGLRTIVVVCDNGAHGSILQAQREQYDADSDYATRLGSPDFAGVARAYGVPAWRVEETAAFPGAMDAALAAGGPALIHLVTDERDIVPRATGDDVV